MNKTKKQQKPPEDSLFLRMLWLAQTFTCFYLIALVDPQISYFSIYGLKIPLLLFNFWTAVCGCFMSYHFRHQDAKWLEWLGIGTILVSCSWFIENLHGQLSSSADVELLLPTVQLLAGLFVSHSFELRARFDFNFSLVLSLILVCFTATLGKGVWFGLGMFTYVVLAATLLLLDCEAKTFGRVQARKMDSLDTYLTMNSKGGSEKTANLIFPTFVLLGLSIAFFLVAPRAESLADQVAAQVYSLVRRHVIHRPIQNPLTKRVRSPFRQPKLTESNEKNKSDSNSGDKEKDRKTNKQGSAESKTKNKGAHDKDSGNPGKASKETGKKETGKKDGLEYSRKAKAEQAIKQKRKSDSSPAQSNSSKQQEDDSKSVKDDAEEAKKKSESEQAGESDNNGSDTNNDGENGDQQASEQAKKDTSTDPSSSHKSTSDKSTGDKSAETGAKKDSGTDSSPGKQSENNKNRNDATAQKKDNLDDQLNEQLKKIESKQNQKKPSDAPKKTIYEMPDDYGVNMAAPTQNMPMFKVECNRTVCFRQGAFDNFDGKQWHVSSSLPHNELPHQSVNTYSIRDAFPLMVPASVPAIRLKQKFRILKNMGGKLIFAGSPYEITYPGPSIDLDGCGNVKGAWFLVAGLEYSVAADEPLYDIKAMQEEGVPYEEEENQVRNSLSKFVQLPDNQSEKTIQLSEKIAGYQDNWFVQARKICHYLRENYKYSTDAKYKTEATNSVDRFLFKTKYGDCKDFASAFVVMCRASGIPARFAVGFLPGEFDPASGMRVVKLKDSHAWGEVYIPSSGWVPFDATPNGIMPAREKEEERYFSTLGEHVENTINRAANSEQADNATSRAQTGQRGQPAGTKISLPNGKTITVNINLWELLKLVPIMIGAILLSGPILLFGRELISKIRLPRRIHPASRIYSKLLRDLKPIGVNHSDSQTSGEYLDRFREKLSEWEDPEKSKKLTEAMESFVSTYNAVYFGNFGSVKELEEKRQLVKDLIRK